MKSSKNAGLRLRNIVVIVPLVLLLALIAVDQRDGWTNGLPAGTGASDPPNEPALKMIGYGYDSPTQAVLTLTNIGTQQITILNVTYDGHAVAQGVSGGALPLFSMPADKMNSSSTCTLAADDIVFPHYGQWNMDTGGLCTPTIQPNGMASLYMSVPANGQVQHTALIHTTQGDFTLAVPIPAPYVAPSTNDGLTRAP